MKEKLIKYFHYEFCDEPNIKDVYISVTEDDGVPKERHMFYSIDEVKKELIKDLESSMSYYRRKIDEYKSKIEKASNLQEQDLYQTESYKEYLNSKLKAV